MTPSSPWKGPLLYPCLCLFLSVGTGSPWSQTSLTWLALGGLSANSMSDSVRVKVGHNQTLLSLAR